jgi:glycosyltransferase involved in cell wall biosynthesis
MQQNSWPLVSFLVSSYNHQSYITDTLQSVANDDYPNKEILIIDDGSTDQSALRIEEFVKDLRTPCRFVQQKNQGVSSTLNRLVELANGEYLRPCGSDDRLLPHGTRKMVLELEKHPQAAALFTDAEVIDENNNTLSGSVLSYLGGSVEAYKTDLTKSLITDWAVAGPVLLWRKTMLSSKPLYNESLFVEDWHMYLSLCSENKIFFFPATTAQYRVHTSNTSFTKDVQKRITNLSHQIKAAEMHKHSFHGSAKIFLSSEKYLLKAKVAYLKRKWIQLPLHLLNYVSSYFIASIYRYLDR